jgi:hypothetical protein
VSLGWVRLALGAGWEPPACGTPASDDLGGVCTGEAAVVSDLSLDRHCRELGAPNATGLAYERLLLALALQSSKASDLMQAGRGSSSHLIIKCPLMG